MANLKFLDKSSLESIFDNNGYVLNFCNRTFAEFFKDYNINIDDNKYFHNGGSKMNRLRAFWELESDALVGEVLEGLLKYAETEDLLSNVPEPTIVQARKTIARLQGKEFKQEADKRSAQREEFSEIDLTKLNLFPELTEVIQQRVGEIKVAIGVDAPLSVIFLCGSTLEGLLLNVVSLNAQKCKESSKAPNDKLDKWSLHNLIEVAHEVGILKKDTKEYSSSLREFRNYIHPLLQTRTQFRPRKKTAEMAWKTLQAAIEDLAELKDGKL